VPAPGPDGESTENGFTIVEVVMSIAVLAMVSASLAGAFWAAIRTAGVSSHRTNGSSIASREIEGMRAVPYVQVGFYADQPGFAPTFEGFTTVTLGSTSPASGPVPQIQPATPDPNAAAGYAPDPDPANASAIVQGKVPFSVQRVYLAGGAIDPGNGAHSGDFTGIIWAPNAEEINASCKANWRGALVLDTFRCNGGPHLQVRYDDRIRSIVQSSWTVTNYTEVPSTRFTLP